MTIYDIFFLLGGLGLFLYGMSLMSEGLSLIAGSKLKKILEKLTRNKWFGAFFGFLITAIIQSSTATTVMVLGFADSSLMTLSQATGVIMGANAGTTLTGILFTFNIQDIVPFVIFLGTVATLFIKRKSFKHMGMIVLGFGILFLGLNLMTSAMMPLRESAFMGDLFLHTQLPIIGLLVGFVVTALIQSSTASVGILLSMVAVGIVTDLNQAIFILYGFNVGTVVTALVASIRANKIAKQVAIVHVLFNSMGALIFTIITILPLGFVSLIQSMSSSIALQLVYAHIIFNVATMFILLPFSKYIIKMAEEIVGKGLEDDNELKFKFIDRRLANTPSIEIELAVKEIGRMFELVLDNFKYSTKIDFKDKDSKKEDKNFELIAKNEEIINYLNKEINKFLVSLNTLKLKDKYVMTIGICYKTITYLERIENLSKDLAIVIKEYKKDEKDFDENISEIESIIGLVEKILSEAYELFEDNEYGENEKRINEIEDLDKKIANLTQTNKELLKSEFDYIRILNNLGRISSNVMCIVNALEHRKN